MTKKNIKIEKIVPPVLYILIILLPIIIAYFNKDNILILQGCTTAFLVFISAGVTYFFTKYFFEYEKYLRWNKIKDYVFNSLDIEFYYILGGIAELCNS